MTPEDIVGILPAAIVVSFAMGLFASMVKFAFDKLDRLIR